MDSEAVKRLAATAATLLAGVALAQAARTDEARLDAMLGEPGVLPR